MTALEEQRGGALDVTITAGNSPYSAQLDNGPGRARLYVVRPTGSGRVFRGGSWYFGAGSARSADRFRDDPSLRSFSLGFRPAISSVR